MKQHVYRTEMAGMSITSRARVQSGTSSWGFAHVSIAANDLVACPTKNHSRRPPEASM